MNVSRILYVFLLFYSYSAVYGFIGGSDLIITLHDTYRNKKTFTAIQEEYVLTPKYPRLIHGVMPVRLPLGMSRDAAAEILAGDSRIAHVEPDQIVHCTGLPNDPFVLEGRQWEFDAEDVYGDSYYFGLEYGQLIAGHWLGSVGFRFTHHNLRDTIGDERMAFMYDFKPTFNQYDLEVNMNYLLNSLASSVWTPYAGLGLHAGIASVDWDEYDAENDLTFGMNLNFGAEVKLYTAASGKSFVTLASMNNWNFMATNDRPKYLQIGGGVKYYMR